ncbi:unnamed protein product [Bursaphelenchus okinawaensis]|uniref:Uncharacterized protein n=1 Tax=Bursaphelenchus okinawaensis TaxID=465554 RepID=A0A811KC37_9BILA|nr:unnamed protein product [Bursaphelenchus okinawaensis]CAG9100676.1 unnamed protein product [Bursaphelenchus okinawaensis]
MDKNDTFFLNYHSDNGTGTVIVHNGTTEDNIRNIFHKLLIIVFFVALFVFITCQLVELCRKKRTYRTDKMLEMRLASNEKV